MNIKKHTNPFEYILVCCVHSWEIPYCELWTEYTVFNFFFPAPGYNIFLKWVFIHRLVYSANSTVPTRYIKYWEETVLLLFFFWLGKKNHRKIFGMLNWTNPVQMILSLSMDRHRAKNINRKISIISVKWEENFLCVLYIWRV